MQKNKKNNIFKQSNATKNGEMVPSYFEWITPEEQKEKANELNEIGKSDKTKRGKKLK